MNTIIEQIKVKIEWLKKEGETALQGAVKTNDIEKGLVCGGIVGACKELLAELDTLQERPVCEDLEEEIERYQEEHFEYNSEFDSIRLKGDYLPSQQTLANIAHHFYELGRQSKEEDVIIQKARTEKQRVLVTETDGNANVFWDARSLDDVKALLLCGLDFIKKQSKDQPACEDVEEAAKAYADDINSNECLYTYTDFTDAFKAGAKWQKEQLMKKAIDAEFCSAGMFMPMIDFKDKRMEGIKYGDTIKVIVIKEK